MSRYNHDDGSKIAAGIVTLLLVLIPSCIGCVGGCKEDYSQGKRVGTVVKFSRKGIVKQSWEGTLHLGATVDAATGANIWNFSVTDDGVVRDVQTALEHGKPVQILYKEWLIGPWSVDSSHIIQQVELFQAGEGAKE